MSIDEIQSELESIERDAARSSAINFCSRVEAIDQIEFHIIDRVDGLLQTGHPPAALLPLKQRAQRVKRRLEAIDARLFQRLRAAIRAGACRGAALQRLLDAYVGPASGSKRPQDQPGYDTLDLFINGLLCTQAVPAETKASEPGMVYYQKTPARIMVELVEQARLTPEAVFYDLGSGLGQVPILVNLLSGASARGVEFEPAYCAYASACATALKLQRVAFIHADARTADYAEGTVFFMYTPFEGAMLQAVLERLRGVAQTRTIRLFTYGPCTPHVARQHWLALIGGHWEHPYSLCRFKSL